ALMDEIECAVPVGWRGEKIGGDEIERGKPRSGPADRARRQIEAGDAPAFRGDRGGVVAEPAADIERARLVRRCRGVREPCGERGGAARDQPRELAPGRRPPCRTPR